MRIGQILSGLLLAGLWMLAPPARAQASAPLSPAQEKRVQDILRDMLKAHPELVEQALTDLETQRNDAAKAAILADGRHFTIGPKDAPVQIVEFFDYRCPYCKAAQGWMSNQARRRDVRLVFVEFPVLGPESEEASRAALAAQRQGRYLPFHEALMAHRGALDGPSIERLAKGAGLDIARLRKDMRDPAIDALLRANHERAASLRFNGTPAFVINGQSQEGFDPAALDRLAKPLKAASR